MVIKSVSGSLHLQTWPTITRWITDARKVATWTQNTYSLAYSDHGAKALLFVIGDDAKLLKINSDFLDGEALKRIAENI